MSRIKDEILTIMQDTDDIHDIIDELEEELKDIEHTERSWA